MPIEPTSNTARLFETARDPSEHSPQHAPRRSTRQMSVGASLQGLSRRSVSPSLAATASSSDRGARPHESAAPTSGDYPHYRFSPERASSTEGESSDVSEGFTAEQLAPYRELEQLHADLFDSRDIKNLDSIDLNADLPFMPNVINVDVDECVVINTRRDQVDALTSDGLASCIGLCARGVNGTGEPILGLLHWSGVAPGATRPEQALSQLEAAMRTKGAVNMSTYLIGGMMSTDPRLDTLEKERGLLALRDRFNIQGAQLHLSRSSGMNDADMVEATITPDKVFFKVN